MQFNPHKYQEYAIKYIEEHPISAIFLDLGLGKTVITLTAINNLINDYLEVNKVLVIAPIRVAKVSWPDEIQKWEHLKHLKYSVVCGTQDERLSALEVDADIYIINRENVQWLIEKSGYTFDFDMVVIDELSSFKNHQAKRFKALMKVRPKVKRIVGLTGTPTSNGLMDLFAEFKLLDMGQRLGRYITKYRKMYFYQPAPYIYIPEPWAKDEIYRLISDITISMKAEDYLDMPKRIAINKFVDLPDGVHELMHEMTKHFVAEIFNVKKLTSKEITIDNAAVLSGKLVQMANGAVYDNDGQIHHLHDAKINALEDLVEAMNGKPLLVAYWYSHDLEIIEKRLDKLGVKYATLNKEKNIRAWNNKELEVGLIHPASAGHGLNLQSGGNTIAWYGLTWSLELYQQTNARLYRQGQNEKSVVIMHIVSAGTIDEHILEVIEGKEKTQSALLNAVKAEITEVENDNKGISKQSLCA